VKGNARVDQVVKAKRKLLVAYQGRVCADVDQHAACGVRVRARKGIVFHDHVAKGGALQ
jgi:hypothetical protein